jgi:PKD repeat protein
MKHHPSPRRHLRALLRVCAASSLLIGAAALLAEAVRPDNTATQSASGGPPTQAAATAPGMPRFFNYTSPPGVGDSSGEPTIGINYRTEKKFSNSMFEIPNGGTVNYYGGLSQEMLRITFDDCSSPAKAIWEEKPLLLAATPRAAGDPILYTDSETGRTFVSQLEGLTPAGSTTDITDDDGETFRPSEGSNLPSDIDHQTFGGGPFAPPLTGGVGVYPNAVYYAAQSVAEARAALSLDGGVTFLPGTVMYNIEQCAGLHGHIKVAPNDGTVYVPNRGCGGSLPFHIGSQQAAIVSEDNGTTWAIRPIPDSTSNGNGDLDNKVAATRDPSIGIARDGTAYFAYQGADGKSYVAVTKNKGVNWEPSVDIGAAPLNSAPVLNSVFHAVVAGDGDRAAVAFLGTETGGDNWACGEGDPCADLQGLGTPQKPPFTGVWYLYVAMTYDGGKTWITQNVTPGDPVQRGGICGSGTCRNLLDFMDVQMDKEGRVVVAGEDGCVGACVDGGPNSFTAKAFVTRQGGGKRLLAEFDPAEPALPGAPRVSGSMDAEKTKVQLAWPAVDDGGSPVTTYNVYRRVGDSGGFTLLATVPQTSFTDVTFDKNANNHYRVTAVNAVGEGPYCVELLPPVAPPLENICKAPGVTHLADAAGDTSAALGVVPTPAGPGMDLLSFQLEQPYAPDGNTKLVFRINTDPGIDPQPPGSGWYVSFKAPDGKIRGARMAFAGSEPTFFSYIAAAGSAGTDGRFVEAGSMKPAEPESHYDAAKGLIEIVIKPGDFGLNPGDTITGFNSAVTQTTDPLDIAPRDATATYDQMPDSLAYEGQQLLPGNAECLGNEAPIAALTATPRSGRAPLTVNFDASGSKDPDAGDSVATYTFNFGDGSPEVTQNTPTISHTYTGGSAFFITCRVTDSKGLASANVASITVQTDATLLNISSRSRVLTGENVMIGGFIVTGTQPKRIAVRGIGPSLQANSQPLAGAMSDPTLELHGPGALIATNDNWKSEQQSEIEAAQLAPADERESVIIRSLQPGVYTTVLHGKNGETGVALVEAYDIDRTVDAQLGNISTRAFVDTGDNALIAGFIAGTNTASTTRVVVRALGPSMKNTVPGALDDPTLEVRDRNGTVIASNDNWRDSQQTEIQNTGLAPEQDTESAVVLTNFDPGQYTAIVRGKGTTTGPGLIEIYNVGNP